MKFKPDQKMINHSKNGDKKESSVNSFGEAGQLTTATCHATALHISMQLFHGTHVQFKL